MIVKEGKSRTVAFLLAFFFGPLGMLYSTVVGGLVMLVVGGILTFFTLGLALFVVWPVCIIWAVLAASPTEYKQQTTSNAATGVQTATPAANQDSSVRIESITDRQGKTRSVHVQADGRATLETAAGPRTFASLEDARAYVA
jgi:hypothetical protein